MSLYQHQVEGAAWLAQRSRGYLGDRPGLGKTRTLLSAVHSDPNARALIVCPAIVRTHWRREIDVLGVGGANFVMSYDNIVRGGYDLMRKLIVDEGVNTLVTDEHHYLKHGTSKRTQLLLGRDGYARRLPRAYAASGTPVPKNPAELWTTLSSLFPDVCVEHRLKTRDDFKERFCIVERRRVRGRMQETILPVVQNVSEFRAIIGKIMLKRTLDDVGLDVPTLDWQTLTIDPTTGDDFYREFADDREWAELREAIEQDVDLASIANEPHIARMRRRLGEFKIASTMELLRSQLEENYEKLVVFAHHRTVLEALRTGLNQAGMRVAYVDGDTSPQQRNVAIDRFQTDPACRVFLGQNIACQTGITLTAARRVFLVEPDWTAVVNDQLGHRVARIGQQAERCIAHMICLAGTLDEAIINRNIQEVRMADTIGLGA